MTRTTTRRPAVLALSFLWIAVAGMTALDAMAQGIRGVTRRTTALERQQPAREFLEAAGVDATGGRSGSSAAGRSFAPVDTARTAVGRPATAFGGSGARVVLPPIAERRMVLTNVGIARVPFRPVHVTRPSSTPAVATQPRHAPP